MEDKNKHNIKILVACHKADPNIRQDDIYMPIQVGAALHPELDLGFQKDNTGDNISEKNPYYCELTALYWAWKNLPKDIEYIGLAHYRRYLNIKLEKIPKIAKKSIILPKKLILNNDLYIDMSIWTSLEDIKIYIKTLLELNPHYETIIKNYFLNNNKLYDCNMFIMNRKDFDEYCTFLFTVLSSFEKKMKIYPYIRQNRVIGYLGELTLGLWIIMNKKKKYEVNKSTSKIALIKRSITNKTNNLSHIIYKLGSGSPGVEINPSVII